MLGFMPSNLTNNILAVPYYIIVLILLWEAV